MSVVMCIGIVVFAIAFSFAMTKLFGYNICPVFIYKFMQKYGLIKNRVITTIDFQGVEKETIINYDKFYNSVYCYWDHFTKIHRLTLNDDGTFKEWSFLKSWKYWE